MNWLLLSWVKTNDPIKPLRGPFVSVHASEQECINAGETLRRRPYSSTCARAAVAVRLGPPP
jgi:hypothetical protein